jgi:predicted RNA-binding protein with PIN domain
MSIAATTSTSGHSLGNQLFIHGKNEKKDILLHRRFDQTNSQVRNQQNKVKQVQNKGKKTKKPNVLVELEDTNFFQPTQKEQKKRHVQVQFEKYVNTAKKYNQLVPMFNKLSEEIQSALTNMIVAKSEYCKRVSNPACKKASTVSGIKNIITPKKVQ